MGASLLALAKSTCDCFLPICFPGCSANHPEALLANIKITAFSPYHFTVKLLIFYTKTSPNLNIGARMS